MFSTFTAPHRCSSVTGGLALLTALMLTSASSFTIARELDGTEHTVEVGDLSETWKLINGATLNVNEGAITAGIQAITSAVNLNGATVLGSSANGIGLWNRAEATITGSFILSDNHGIALSRNNSYPEYGQASRLDLVGSTIRAGVVGILATDATVTVDSSQVLGGETGIRFLEGDVRVTGGSTIRGGLYGFHIANGSVNSVHKGLSVSLDGSTVEGTEGPAIRVFTPYVNLPTDVDITVSNGSTLIGGNGNILEVGDERTSVTFIVDNSQLEGDVLVAEGGRADITLQNNASLTGQLTGVENLALASGGTWKMIADGGVTNLAMDGGAVELSDGSGSSYNTLILETLSGSGTFVLGTDIAAGNGDRLVIAGDHSGDHTLHVRNTGVEPVSGDELLVVDTNGGDATFALQGAAADIGVYKYYLEQQGDDWVLVGSDGFGRYGNRAANRDNPGNGGSGGGELTASAQTVIGLHAAAANVFQGELGTLRQRMGEVRAGNGENGIWGRTYGRDIKGNGAAGVDFDQSLWGMQVGAEKAIDLGGLPLVVGLFGGYSNSTIGLDDASKGEIDSGYGGIYATWAGSDGLYVDGLFKVNRFSSEARAVMSDGAGTTGDYGVTAVGGQVEAGKTFEFGNGWYAEPFAQVTALRVGSFDYGLDNGMTTSGDAFASLQGRVGATLGFNRGGAFQPYIRAAVAQEFSDENTLRINTIGFDNSFKGTRGEIGTGFAYQVNDALKINADVDYFEGKNISRNWGGNLGLKYAF